MHSYPHADQAIDGTVLPQIVVWLEQLPNRPSQWKSFFMDKAGFWDEFCTMVGRVLVRRYVVLPAPMTQDPVADLSRSPFGDSFCDDGQTEDEVLTSFLTAYLRLCIRLLQVDAEMLASWNSEEPYWFPVLSQKHIRHINSILRDEKCPVFHLLGKEYGADTREMGVNLMRAFIQADGIQHIFDFATRACGKVPPQAQNWIANWMTPLATTIGWFLYAASDGEDLIDRARFNQYVLQYFRRYDTDLQIPSKVSDTGVTRDLIAHLSNLLRDLCEWDGAIAAQLVDEFLDFRDPDSPTTATSEDAEANCAQDAYRSDPSIFPALVSHLWKFKLLRKYMVKGRMELRVMSIGTMDNALVEIWKEYNPTLQSIHHPVMQCLADFLLHERVVDYIISVDSHPQLISRSGNIVGFLVVTHRYTGDQTDAIWNTVSKSADPRVVSATMTMLRGIYSLMEMPEQLYLMTKFYDLRIESYNMDILRFLRELSSKFGGRYLDWSLENPKSRPWNILVRIIQDTSPGKDTSKLFNALHHEAVEQLRPVAIYVGPEERHDIYRQCAAHIASRSPKATASVRAIYVLAITVGFQDIDFFKENPDLVRQILEEMCAFVKDDRDIAFDTPQALALQYRLDLLSHLICRATDAIPVDMYQQIWDHLLGKYAQTNEVRDMSWSKFMETLRTYPQNEFYRQLISAYVPKLEPYYYTPGLYEFIAAYRFPTTRAVVNTSDGEKELLQIRGADLLWPIIISAPQDTIEDRAARLLATRYLELDPDHGVTLEDVEAAHVALVDQCTKELQSAYKVLRSTTADNDEGDDYMDVVLSDTAKQQNERRFTRTILFLKLLLMSIRTKPEFNRARRSDSKVEPLEIELPYGNPIEIKYQSASSSEKQSVLLGSENTLQDLYSRLCNATGYSKVNLFAKGQRLNVAENGNEKIADLNLAGAFLLVQRAPGSVVTQTVVETSSSCSVFEAAILNHFEDLFACMDAEDAISRVVRNPILSKSGSIADIGQLYDFLTAFAYRERIAESVVNGTGSADDLFPPGRLYQAKYAAFALQWKLKEQLRRVGRTPRIFHLLLLIWCTEHSR